MERNEGTLLWCSGAVPVRGGDGTRGISLKLLILIEPLWAEPCR